MGKKKVTIKDVANLSGVSIATVSLILNNQSHKFSPSTVEKVLKATEMLNYQPSYVAQQMITKKTKTIGLIIPDITNPFFSTLVKGIESVLYQDNFVTILANAGTDELKESNYLDELARRSVDGFIIASSVVSNTAINHILREKNKPFIVLDQKKSEGYSDSVLTDDYTGGQLAAKHLIDLGHTNLAVVVPNHMTSNIANRLKGFQEIVKSHRSVTSLLVTTTLSKEGGYLATSEILASDATAIFAINDELAFGLYRGINEAGKRIPIDYSVIGYDNIEMCEYVEPKLTTISQPIFELGETVAHLLLERIEQPDKQWEEKMLPVHLVKRFSTRGLTKK